MAECAIERPWQKFAMLGCTSRFANASMSSLRIKRGAGEAFVGFSFLFCSSILSCGATRRACLALCSNLFFVCASVFRPCCSLELGR